jgi:hypothetical protein
MHLEKVEGDSIRSVAKSSEALRELRFMSLSIEIAK